MKSEANLLIIDLDGTISKQDNLVAFTSFMVFRKKKYNFILGYILFGGLKLKIIQNTTLKKLYAYFILKNQEVKLMNKIVDEYLSECFKDLLNKDVLNWINNNIDGNTKKLLLSANYNFLVKPIADILVITDAIGIELEERGGYYTGKIIGKIPYGSDKITITERKFDNETYKNKIAIADSKSDLALLNWVKKGVKVKSNTSSGLTEFYTVNNENKTDF